jgi:hypothetical protein
MSDFIYITGPTGRDLKVDSDGRLICNADASTSGFIFGYGEKGYPLLVDGAGHLLVNVSGISVSGGGSGGNYYEKNADLIPDSAVTYDIGADTTRFDNIFSEHINLSSGIIFDNNIKIGDPSGLFGTDTIAIGNGAGLELIASDFGVIAIGEKALQNLGKAATDGTIAIGYNALSDGEGFPAFPGLYQTRFNTVIGYAAGQYLTGSWNVVLGMGAAGLVSDGMNHCVAIGEGALFEASPGDYVIAIGTNAGRYVVGQYSTAVGSFAMQANAEDGNYNTAVGTSSLGNFKDGIAQTTAIGCEAGYNASGVGNVMLGYYAGHDCHGYNNVIIGTNAGDFNPIEGIGNTIVGSIADLDSGSLNFAAAIGCGAIASGSNTMRLGNSDCEVQCERLKVERDFRLGVYTSGSRPSPGIAGRLVFNTDDGKINVDDGTNWTWPDGTVLP